MASPSGFGNFLIYGVSTLLGVTAIVMAFGGGLLFMSTGRIDALYTDFGNVKAELAKVSANTENTAKELSRVNDTLKSIDSRMATNAGRFLQSEPIVVKDVQQLGKFLQQNRLKGGVFILPEDPVDWGVLKNFQK